MIFLTSDEYLPEDTNAVPDRLTVWLGNEDSSDAARLGWVLPHTSGPANPDFRPWWAVQFPDGLWSEVDELTVDKAIEQLRAKAGADQS